MKNIFAKIGRMFRERTGSRRKPSSEAGSEGFFSRRQRYVNKKRFSTVTATIVAVVLIPVLVGATGSSANKADVENTLPPVNFQEPVNTADEVQAEKTAADANVLPQQQATADPADAGTAVTGEITPDPEPTPTPEPEPTYMELVPETNHADVVKLQVRLTELNYMENDEPTDYYGPITQQAVKYFQRKHGLTVDGTAGVETQQMLFSDAAQPYSVTIGAEGADVESIQQRLADLGYPVSVTGYFGDDTASAVKYFQRMNGLSDDGSVGQYTKEVLYSNSAEHSVEYWEQKEAEEAAAAEESSTTEGSSTEGSSSGGNSSGSGSSGSGSSTDNSSNSSGSSEAAAEQPAADPTPSPEPEPAPSVEAPAADPGSVEAFVNAALAQEGVKYVLGGKGPNSFDCSGLVYYALKQSGNNIGYMTSGGWAKSGYTTIGSIDELQRGDIICITGHVAIYLGDGMMVDASTSNGKVVVRSVGSWARNNFICGKRPL